MPNRVAGVARNYRNVLLPVVLAASVLATASAAAFHGVGKQAAGVDELALHQQVGQLIMLRFEGTTPPAYVRDALREQHVAGAILFRDNVAVAMAAAVSGWRAGGVAATAKHFPGLGAATVNTDHAPVTVTRTRRQLETTDLPPFRAESS